ncbi:MAG TPA: hypothetical protein VF701_10390 [Thermoanaerobaculia bacterium]
MKLTTSLAVPCRWIGAVAMALALSLLTASAVFGQEMKEVPPEPPAENSPVVPPGDQTPPVPEEQPEVESPEEEAGEEAEAIKGDEEVPVPAARRAGNPCKVRNVGDEPRLDQFRREIFETVCEAAAKFDSFFGNRRFDEEAHRTHGRAGLRVIWDEEDGVDFDGTLKVRVDFPNLDHRVNAFLGREDEDAFLAGTEDNLDFLPQFFQREGRQEWIVGLGYRPVGTSRNALDFDAGVDVGSSVDPFLRSRYRHYWLVGDDNLIRARQTVYWTTRKGVGSGTLLEFERPLGQRTLARVSANVVFDDETEGGDWQTGVTLFRGFSPDAAIAWYVGVDGETGREVPIESYGTRLTYRQRMLREWFFGELITGVTWPRDRLDQRRERAYHLGVGFGIQFSAEGVGLGRNP